MRPIGWDGRRGALVTYGRGLGGIAVIERKAKPGKSRDRLNLPTVSINGVTGRELATALGTAIDFQRQGVDYTVLGSVPAAAAEAAARGL